MLDEKCGMHCQLDMGHVTNEQIPNRTRPKFPSSGFRGNPQNPWELHQTRDVTDVLICDGRNSAPIAYPVILGELRSQG